MITADFDNPTTDRAAQRCSKCANTLMEIQILERGPVPVVDPCQAFQWLLSRTELMEGFRADSPGQEACPISLHSFCGADGA